MTNDDRKMLQELQTHECWPILEKFLDEYIKSLGLDGDIKRETSFETLWQRAYVEGGANHLKQFFALAESEARKYV